MGSFFGRIIVSLPLGESSASLPRKAMGLDAWWGWWAGGLVAGGLVVPLGFPNHNPK